MSEGWEAPGGGHSTDVEDDAAPQPRAEAPEVKQGGWVVLPPHPDAPEGSTQSRRYRAPWATGTTASITRLSPAPASDPAPEAPAPPKSRRFSLRRKGSAEVEAPPAAPTPAPAPERNWQPKAPAADGPTGEAPPAPPEAAPERPGPAPAAGPRVLEFTGTAGEYFRVWIVNVCLTVLTLGVYSAWAKVRTRRYFYRHTRLEGSPFDYLAEPMQILKGRAVLVGFMTAYGALGSLFPMLQGALSLAFTALVPWAVVRSLKFRSRTSTWRNIRFGFDGTYKEAAKVFLGWPILVAFTFGLAYPYYQWRRHRFMVERRRFGTQPFEFNATAGSFYKLHLKMGLMVLGLTFLFSLIVFLMPMGLMGLLGGAPGIGMGAPGAGPMGGMGGGSGQGGMMLTGAGLFLAAALSYFMVWTYMRAQTWNLVWDGTALGPHGFSSMVRGRDLFRLYLMNTLGIMVSCGLLVPWARVRMARYRVETLRVTGSGTMTDFVQGAVDDTGATGAEFGEAMDLDLGL